MLSRDAGEFSPHLQIAVLMLTGITKSSVGDACVRTLKESHGSELSNYLWTCYILTDVRHSK
jgi:hypothetical protein